MSIMKPNKAVKGFKSISYRIMMIMMATTTMFLAAVLLLNATLLRDAKEQVIFHQLKESAAAQKNHEKTKLYSNELDESIWAAHFLIRKENDEFVSYKDRFNKVSKEDLSAIAELTSGIGALPSDLDTLKLTYEGKDYYIYREWIEEESTAMVYYVTQGRSPLFTKEMVIFLLAAFAISWITSRVIAKGIAKQVGELDIFAESIANRNWEAPMPTVSEDEIGLLAQSLEKMRDALKIAEERDRQFLQSSSHDLKTPVMLIKGYAQAIIDGVGSEEKRTHAATILGEAEKLEKRILQLLRLNTLDQSLNYSNEWEEIRLDRLIKSVADKFKLLSPELNWTLKLDETLVKGNRESLLIAFENLFDNQCRYATKEIYISLTKEKVEICNDGAPFHTEDFNSLFNPHVKDESGKFGLGLAIVQKVIKGHHWQIKAENLSKGVCFTIKL